NLYSLAPLPHHVAAQIAEDEACALTPFVIVQIAPVSRAHENGDMQQAVARWIGALQLQFHIDLSRPSAEAKPHIARTGVRDALAPHADPNAAGHAFQHLTAQVLYKSP